VLQSAANDVPRLDYNPATLAARGLLIEEQRTNLLLRSEDFATTWSALNVTVATNNANSPAGTLTADTITPAASTAAHLISQSVTVTASTAYSASVFVKSDGAPFVQIAYDNGASVGAFMNVNLSTGAIARGPELAGGATSATGSVTNIGNGFYRIVVGATHTGTTGRVLISPLPAGESLAGPNPSTTTAATDKIILWGAQIEAGAFLTSYIPTTTTALTRSADIASVTTLSPWFNASAGTLYAEYNIPFALTAGTSPRLATLIGAGGAAVDELPLFISQVSGKAASANAFTGSVNAGRIDASASFAANTTTKATYAYASNDRAVTTGGSSPTISTAAYTIPTVTTLRLGQDGGGTNNVNGYLRRISYYNTRLPDAQLQALTAP